MKAFTSAELVELWYRDWFTAGPLRLNPALPLDELAEAVFLRRVRILLHAMLERGSVPATADGFLDPHFVAVMTEPLEWSPETRDHAIARSRMVQGRRSLDEIEVWPLRVMRLVLERAGLLERDEGAFRLTALGAESIGSAAAGRLFARLFRTALRELDFRMLDPQAYAAAPVEHRVRALYRIGRTAWKWAGEAELIWPLVEVLHPGGPPSIADWWGGMIRVEDELIEPLLGFGLLRRRESRARVGGRRHQFRKTELFDRFLRFHFEDEPEHAEPDVIRVLPLSRNEREHLSQRAIGDELARRVRLEPAPRGWVALELSLTQLKSLLGAVWKLGEAPPRELRSAIERMLCLLAGAGGIVLRFNSRERARLRHQPELLPDLRPALVARLLSESEESPAVPMLFGETLLLRDLLDQSAMSDETPELVACDQLAVLHRLESELEAQWVPTGRGRWFNRKLQVGPAQRIPIALRRSEAELIQSLERLPPEIAANLKADEGGGWQVHLTLEEVEVLAGELLVTLEGERVERLEARLDYVQRCFDDGVDRTPLSP